MTSENYSWLLIFTVRCSARSELDKAVGYVTGGRGGAKMEWSQLVEGENSYSEVLIKRSGYPSRSSTVLQGSEWCSSTDTGSQLCVQSRSSPAIPATGKCIYVMGICSCNSYVHVHTLVVKLSCLCNVDCYYIQQ